MNGPPLALLITGTVGAGKTTTMAHVATRLRAAVVPHATIDLDTLSSFWPTPHDDEFGFEVGLRNLAGLAKNYLANGALRLVVAGVCETRDQRNRYAQAIGAPLTVCRLQVDHRLREARLRHRHSGDDYGLRWHLERAPKLEGILDRSGCIDVTLTVNDHNPADVAVAVLQLVGWATDVPNSLLGREHD